MTEGEAAPAASESDSRSRESGSRNLLMRAAVAAVLIPLAVAIAYAGGWLWATLVTLAAIGLFLEWLTVVGLAGATRVSVPGVVALAVAGFCLVIGRIDAALIVLAFTVVWFAAGFAHVAGCSLALPTPSVPGGPVSAAGTR